MNIQWSVCRAAETHTHTHTHSANPHNVFPVQHEMLQQIIFTYKQCLDLMLKHKTLRTWLIVWFHTRAMQSIYFQKSVRDFCVPAGDSLLQTHRSLHHLTSDHVFSAAVTLTWRSIRGREIGAHAVKTETLSMLHVTLISLSTWCTETGCTQTWLFPATAWLWLKNK